jgi:hypothetical protein
MNKQHATDRNKTNMAEPKTQNHPKRSLELLCSMLFISQLPTSHLITGYSSQNTHKKKRCGSQYMTFSMKEGACGATKRQAYQKSVRY